MLTFEQLRTDQQSCVTELYERDALYVVMRMGGGKTATCLTAINELIRDGHVRKAIIMAPPLVAATVWPHEPTKWDHLSHLRVAPLIGGPKAREATLARDDVDVYTVSDGVVGWLVDTLAKLPDDDPRLDLLAYDEPKLKSPRGKMRKQLERLLPRVGTKWLFSGTPRPNGYEDLFAPAQLLAPGLWSRDFDEWRRRNFMPMDFHGYAWEVHEFRAKQLEADASTFMVRAAEPADARRGTLSCGPDFDTEIDLPADARKRYAEMERDLITEVLGDVDRADLSDEEYEAEVVVALSRAVGSSKLAQIAQGFLYGNADADGSKSTTILHDAKVEALRYILDAVGSERSVITYGFTADVAAITGLLKKQKRSYGVLGQGVSIKQKMKFIEAWNERRLDHLVLHPASAGHGVELQFGGRRMIHYCVPWSAEQLDQVMKRLDRPGQTEHVYSHMIIARDTVDVVKRNRTHFKMRDQEAFKDMLRVLL